MSDHADPALAPASLKGTTRPVVRLRPAEESDLDAMTLLEEQVNVAALTHLFPPEQYPYPRDTVRERWGRELADPSFRIWVADSTAPNSDEGPGSRQRRVVAYCACRDTDGVAWLEHLGVAEELQGTGVARILVDNARASFPGRSLQLWVLAGNPRARRFYEREGWQHDGETMPAVYPPYPEMLRYVAPPA